MFVSRCCKAHVDVEDNFGSYYVCANCWRACELTECRNSTKNASLDSRNSTTLSQASHGIKKIVEWLKMALKVIFKK